LAKAIEKAGKKAKEAKKSWSSGGKKRGFAAIVDHVVGYEEEHEGDIRARLD
jgi:hypothetical protein